MHVFYLAHDSSWAVRSLIAASEHDWHWFLLGNAVALFGWTFLELVTIHNCISSARHRRDIWGTQRPGQKSSVTASGALWQAVIHAAGFCALLNFVIDRFADDIEIYDWYILTNVVLAWGPSELWASRPSREYNTVLYATTILLSTINSFAPWNMWQYAAPDVYGTFWYKILGAATLIINLDNFKRLLSKPATDAETVEVVSKGSLTGKAKANKSM